MKTDTFVWLASLQFEPKHPQLNHFRNHSRVLAWLPMKNDCLPVLTPTHNPACDHVPLVEVPNYSGKGVWLFFRTLEETTHQDPLTPLTVPPLMTPLWPLLTPLPVFVPVWVVGSVYRGSSSPSSSIGFLLEE